MGLDKRTELMQKITRRDACLGALSILALTAFPGRASFGQRLIEGTSGHFRALGSLAGTRTEKSYHMVAGLSSDGSVAVGQSELNGQPVAYVWSESYGMVPLSESSSIAWAISGDSRTIVGRSHASGSDYATIWTTESGVPFSASKDTWSGIVEKRVFDNTVTDISEHFGEFNAISPDGQVLAGQTDSLKGRHAFWIDTSVDPTHIAYATKLIAQASESAIYAITDPITGHRYAACGTFGDERETGYSLTLSGAEEVAFNAMRALADAEVSIDCAIAQLQQSEYSGRLASVGGSSTNDSNGNYVAVLRILERTTEDQVSATAMKLGALQGGDHGGLANVISNDGVVVAGNASVGVYKKKEWRPFVWDAQNGMRDLQMLAVRDYGMDLAKWDLRSATAMSENGLTIGGWGYDPSGQPEPWIMTLNKNFVGK